MWVLVLTMMLQTPTGEYANSMNSVAVGHYNSLINCTLEQGLQKGKNHVVNAFCVAVDKP